MGTKFLILWLKEFFLWPRCVACGILFRRPGIEPVPPAVEAWSPNHWTAREFLVERILVHLAYYLLKVKLGFFRH